MFIEILNHMEADELRNYIAHLGEVYDAQDSLLHARQECIDYLSRLVSAQNYVLDSRRKLDQKLVALHQLEDKYESKYEQYIPRPECCKEA